ncbi:AN1-type zinc finger protein 4 [Nephila pilipes]|uniref:AN1-type zinc finger protein 4 n=1 Tax=Nephila pilipes TaxID=299642 RepID=A0A8X6PAH5_NEPPI|nr:AN1-type zinc finger protein 4 [Nephila pilipes]
MLQHGVLLSSILSRKGFIHSYHILCNNRICNQWFASITNAKMAENRMELFIETLTGTAFELSCSPLETIVSIKAKIQYSEGIPVSQQHLIWKSQELNDDLCLQDYCINDGATLKLVLGMRGGPINTRQVSDTKKLKDLAEYVERSSETAGSSGRPFTVLVFHDGDKVHMYTLMERGECAVSPLSGTISETSSVTSIKNIEELDEEVAKENEATREKIAQLQEQLRALNINKPKKFSASAARPNPFSVQEKPPTQKCKEDFYLPPIQQQRDRFDSPSKQYFAAPAQMKMKSDQKSDNAQFPPEKQNQEFIFGPSRNSGGDAKKQSEKLSKSFQNLSSNPKTTTALDCIANSISTYMLASPNKSPNEKNSQSCSNFLPYIPSALGASSIQKKSLSHQSSQVVAVNVNTPCLDSIIKYDPSRLKKAHKQLPVTSSQALSAQKFIDLDGWLQNRPKTSPDSITYKNIGEKVVKDKTNREDRNRRKLKHSIKNPLSLSLSGGKASLMMQMFSENQDVSFNLSPANVDKTNSNTSSSHSKSSVGSLVTSTIKTFKPYMLNNSEVQEDCDTFSNVKSTKVSLRQNEETNRPQSGKKLPLIKAKKKSKRCSLCSKKTGLATSYTCRCGKNFCATHRYAEVHHCSYDYKTEGRRILQLNNPVVAASKLPKI